MTNYEWVKENQEDVIQKALASNMTIHKDEVINMIVNNDDVVKESIIAFCSVDTHDNKIVVGNLNHIGNHNYLVSCNAVAKWLDKERALEPAYPIGTALFDKDKNVAFYNGLSLNKEDHLLTYHADKIGDENRGFSVTDAELQTDYKLLTVCDISPAYPTEYLVAKRQ